MPYTPLKGIGVGGGFWSIFEVFGRKSKIWAPRQRCMVRYYHHPYRLAEIYTSAPSGPPHLKKKEKPMLLGRNQHALPDNGGIFLKTYAPGS